MKFYEGFAGVTPQNVFVREEGYIRRPLEHHVLHSPTGFSWGYYGSGPAELARCILWDFLGREPHPALYQKFKEDYIADFAADWILSSEAIESWLDLNSGIPREIPTRAWGERESVSH